MVKGKNKRGSR